ncbi:lytic polysaccharide monooxygenase [Paenibacillus sp. IHBB 10380]|uniref:lytic polysaccharide monooxygenase n=1 Tax=Paenibacillus sp. IHBB 10380 TaxID=1566358 RepID=UPI0005DA1BDC|nr:lytic polysaccharide monooxygenase [Paenibacillus sp. IHBB 10380]AJS59930.1 chitin-binding protein [Paenibacillus sp. IHBB 10380]
MTILSLTRPGKIKLLVASGMMLMLAMAMFFGLEGKASAHGYVNSPSSRAALCASGVNKNCGLIIYEPYSLEALKGFPAAGPADGKIASANGQFAPLDDQSATRWSKVNLSPGTTTFNWNIKVPHATSSWKYYITKQDWNPNAPLSRASFDLAPFCSVSYHGTPGGTYSDTCNVPNRTGYQVILAVWEIADTANAFYNVIDVNFAGNLDNIAPTAPASVTVSNIATTSATVTWTASTDNVGVAGYRIFNGSTQIASTNGAISYNLTGLTSNTSYNITVKAFDAAGNVSAESNSAPFTTLTITGPDIVPPTAPTSLHVMGSTTSTTVPLVWSASSDNVAVTGYQVFRGTTLVATVSGSTLEYLVSNLTANTAYTFTVKAVDASGNVSAESNTVNVTTPAAPITYTEWNASTVYVGGNKVTHNGANYEAKWWTQGEMPGSAGADVWKLIP